MRVRRAVAEDAPALLGVKRALTLAAAAPPGRGGFLLGSSLEHYRAFVAHDSVLVAETAGGGVAGFAVVLGFETLSRSDLWAKRESIRFSVPPEAFGVRPAYFEQLAFLPEPRFRTYAKYVAFLSVQGALETHDGVFATTVQAPFENRAALPFLRVTGFEQVGSVCESYPEVGAVVSDVHYLSRAAFRARLETPAFRRFLPRAEAHLS